MCLCHLWKISLVLTAALVIWVCSPLLHPELCRPMDSFCTQSWRAEENRENDKFAPGADKLRNSGCWCSWDWTSTLTLNRKGSSSLLKNLQCIKKIMWKLRRTRCKFNNTWLFYVSGGKSEILRNYSEYICMYTSLFMGTYPGKHILRNVATIKALDSDQT